MNEHLPQSAPPGLPPAAFQNNGLEDGACHGHVVCLPVNEQGKQQDAESGGSAFLPPSGKSGNNRGMVLIAGQPNVFGKGALQRVLAEVLQEPFRSDIADAKLLEEVDEAGDVSAHACEGAGTVSECASEYHGHLAQTPGPALNGTERTAGTDGKEARAAKAKGPGHIASAPLSRREWLLMQFVDYRRIAFDRLHMFKELPLAHYRESARYWAGEARKAYAEAMALGKEVAA